MSQEKRISVHAMQSDLRLCFSRSRKYNTVLYSKSCLKGLLKNRPQTKVLTTYGSLMKVERIAKCSLGAFCNTFDLHIAIIGLEKHFFSLTGRLRQVLL